MKPPHPLLKLATDAFTNADRMDIADALQPVLDRLRERQDGPVESGFRWGHRTAPLEPAAHLLLCYVWPRRHRVTQVSFAEAEVWGPNVKPSALRGAVARINVAFGLTNCPKHLSVKAGLLVFE